MIILQFDRGYYKWGKLLLTSLAKNYPGKTVFINSVNLYNFQINMLKKTYSPLIIENHKISMKKKDRGDIMISRKPYILKEIIERFNEDKYLMLDADMIVRKPLDKLFAKLDTDDAVFAFRDGVWDGKIYDHLKIASGVILIKPIALPIIEKWIEVMENETEISNIKRGKWFWDQITLWKAVEETTNFNYGTIDISYFQNDFSVKDAVIWSANVSKKEKAKTYRIMKKELFNN